ncbi:head GIN domain-containing protein [Tenacibaculum sp. MEBiC06402]|uniref:head GIN domain-containing protein n=1 Tax=unclassified Tenacibaculum TaxID=2635139 RepID=UPI003B9B1BFD
MKRFIYISILFFTIVSSAQRIERSVRDFETLKVYNGIDIELIQSDKQELIITGEKAEKVKVKEGGKTLKIMMRFPETTADGKVKVVLYFNKDISVIDANEGVTLTCKSIEQGHIEVKAQEGAFVNMVVNTKHLSVKSSSGGVIKLSGKTKNEDIKLDLGATYHGYNLETENVTNVKAGSGSKAEILAGETLKAKVTFGGTILYKGQPEFFTEKKVIGGTVEERN